MKHSLNSIRNIYFIGAGGIGMSALERYFLSRGVRVAGYDRTRTELTDQLENEGVAMSYTDNVSTIPTGFGDKADTLVVYTPAVPADLAILRHFRDEGFEVVKRSELLGIITRGTRSLCFAGTHGKTTTSSMAAHLLHTGPVGCNAFIGGVLQGYDTNFLQSASSPYTVVEADEFDRSFHRLEPQVAVVTAADPDHLDIYGTEEEYLEAFAHFTSLVRPGGAIIMHKGLKFQPRPAEGVRVYTYSIDQGDFHASYIRTEQGVLTFDIVTPRGTIRNVHLGAPLRVNIENAVAAVAAVCATDAFDPETVRQAMSSFRGVKRRFEVWLKEPGLPLVIDDYAHHPREIEASIASVRELHPGREITVVFQPHLYTRTRDFADQFAAALSTADRVIMTDLYPAREQPIPGISSKTILDKVRGAEKELIPLKNLTDELKSRNFDILMTMGAGDLYERLPRIVKDIKEKTD